MKFLITLGRDERFETFFPKENMELAESLGEVIWNEGAAQWSREEAAEKIGDADVYVTGWDSPRLDETILDKAKNLKLMVHLCGTVVPYASDAVWDRGVRVISGNDIMAESVAEATVAYILTAQRRIPFYHRRFTEKKIWREGGEYTDSLIGKTIGLVSYGAIAKHLVRMLEPFRCKIKVYDIVPIPTEYRAMGCEFASLEDVFKSSDIVSIQTAYNEKTHHMIGKELLSQMRDDALLLNTARGAVINEKELIEELRRGRIRAFLDVYEKEPPAPDNELFDLPNVYMMPHMGGSNAHLYEARVRELTDIASAYVGGRISALAHEVTRDKTAFMTLK